MENSDGSAEHKTGQGTKAIRNEKYDEFLLSDHKAISDAHFNTCLSISSFFKYYILIVTLPIPVVAALLKFDNDQTLSTICKHCGFALAMMLLLVSLLGVFVMAYIANLRFDAVLYARHVNGIRKYFSNKSGASYEEECMYRALPILKSTPRYSEWRYFLWVVLAFSLLNATYSTCGLATYFAWAFLRHMPDDMVLTGQLAALFERLPVSLSLIGWWVISFGASVWLYYRLAYWRECGYNFARQVVGVDIDGVLNKHREHFCLILKERCGKELEPEAITTIPVHAKTDLRIEEIDEYKVFNTSQYWTQMPTQDMASSILHKIRNALGYKIYIFTHRDWPQFKQLGTDRPQYESEWGDAGCIEQITEKWLREKDFPYDKLIVEKGNIHTTAPLRRIRSFNRFIVSAKKGIRVFVEDDIQKAVKLADICEVVFLMDHPYNQIEASLPINVLRVRTWEEIYARLKTL